MDVWTLPHRCLRRLRHDLPHTPGHLFPLGQSRHHSSHLPRRSMHRRRNHPRNRHLYYSQKGRRECCGIEPQSQDRG